MRSLSKLPNFRWCAGDGCESGQIPSGSKSTLVAIHPPSYWHRPGRNPKWKCRKCSACNCFNCKTLYHEMKTCQQYQRFKQVDGESLKTILKTTKGCPKRGCMRRVEKHKYCKDTFCEIKGGKSVELSTLLDRRKLMNGCWGGCGTEFCWNCKVIYSANKRLHLAGCRFASSQTRPKPSARDQLYAEDWDKDPEYEAPDDLYVWDRTWCALIWNIHITRDVISISEHL